MTIIDEYFSTCNDCGFKWTSYVGVSTNTFGMTPDEAESHLEHFAGLEVDSPFYCCHCGSFDISYKNPDGYTKEGRTQSEDLIWALVPPIRMAMHQWEHKADAEEKVREGELRRLTSYEESVVSSANKLASASGEEDRKAVLNQFAGLVRQWDIDISSNAHSSDIPVWLRR
jgi:hypothetical protein